MPPTETTTGRFPPPAALLLDALHADRQRFGRARAQKLSAQEWDQLVDLAVWQRVAGLLAARLEERGLDAAATPGARQVLRAAARRTLIANLRLQADLRRVVDALHARGIGVIVLKGPHLAELVYRSVTTRSIGDLDLMVRWSSLAEAAAVLEGLGYQPHAPYRLDIASTPYYSLHLPRFRRPDATPVEMHWNIVDAGSPVDPDELWARAVPARLAERDVHVLCTEDLFVHVCGHASHLHGFEFGLRPLYDIAAMTERAGATLDWDLVVTRSRAWGWSRGNSLVLRLARDLAGAVVPEDAIARLGADAPGEVRATALAHMTASAAERRALKDMTTNLASLTAQPPLDRFRTLWRRVFLPRQAMAQSYPVAPGSRWIPLYYPLRAFQVFRRHWQPVVRLLGHDDELQARARRKLIVDEWLSGPHAGRADDAESAARPSQT
jgi:hypothetical protein